MAARGYAPLVGDQKLVIVTLSRKDTTVRSSQGQTDRPRDISMVENNEQRQTKGIDRQAWRRKSSLLYVELFYLRPSEVEEDYRTVVRMAASALFLVQEERRALIQRSKLRMCM